MIDTETLHEKVVGTLQRIGEDFRRDWQQRGAVEAREKAPNDYVTQWDIAVQDEIVQHLKRWTPDGVIFSEEMPEFPLNNHAKQLEWILDPIDGTTNLMHGHPHFSVSLALAVDDTVVRGWVYDLLRNELFDAYRGGGARLNGKPIRVSPVSSLSRALVSIGTPVNKAELQDLWPIWQRLFAQVQDIRRTGSAALDLAWVACGRLDAYLEHVLRPWDWAAGVLLVTEAGGTTATWDNKVMSRASMRQSVVATNTHLRSAIAELLPPS